MAINVIVEYNGGFLPDILLLTQAPIVVGLDGITNIIVYSIITAVVFCFVLVGFMMYYYTMFLFLLFV